MWEWLKRNKEWLFQGIGVVALTAAVTLFWPKENKPPAASPGSTVQQTHSGTGDNVAGNKTVTTDNSVRQASISGDNIARDKIINNYLLGSVDYQQIEAEIKDGEELLAGIAPEKTSLRLKQSAKLAELRKRLENFKAEVFRLHELFTRIPINTERLRRAKEHFDKGEFREADAVLKTEEIERDVERLKTKQTAAKDKLAAIEQSLADRANEFLLKAQLSLVTPLAEGEDRFRRTEGYFMQALAAARTAEVLFSYAAFLYQNNALSKAEPLFQEVLQQVRKNAKAEPKAFLQYVATTLNNLGELHRVTKDYGSALKEFEEALKLDRSFAEIAPKTFLPYVAGTLNNLAILHSQTQAYGPALKEYEEALKLYRSLAETEPKAFLQYVATTLNNLATLHQETQDYGPALKEYEEALKIRRSLAEAEPKAFLTDVATTLNNLAALHSQTQAYDSALKEYEESLKIRRSLAETEPKAFSQDLAETLINLSIFYLQAVPDKAKSVAYAQEARDILIPLCKQAPHLQGHLDHAERLLAANSTAPVSTPVK